MLSFLRGKIRPDAPPKFPNSLPLKMERISGILSKALFQSVSREYKSRKMERERERERKFFFRQVRVPPHLLLDPKVQIVLTSSSAQFSSINLVKPYLKREYFSIEAC